MQKCNIIECYRGFSCITVARGSLIFCHTWFSVTSRSMVRFARLRKGLNEEGTGLELRGGSVRIGMVVRIEHTKKFFLFDLGKA